MELARGPRQNQLLYRSPEWRSIVDGAPLTRFGALGVAPMGYVDIEALDMLSLAPDSYLDRDGKLVSVLRTRGSSLRANPKTAPLRRFIEVDENFCRMIGYYMAEGSIGGEEHSVQFAGQQEINLPG